MAGSIIKTIPTAESFWYGCLENSSIGILIFELGMQTIPKYIATNCTSLKIVYLPAS